MITEIIKIIEGGLSKDPHKVLNYARLLAENLSKSGDRKGAERIVRALQSKQAQPVFMDQLFTAPVDQETRMNIADLVIPQPDQQIPVILSENLRQKLDGFIGRIQHRSELQAAGIDPQASLLLYGPPGCGKTTLAHYIAHHMQLPLVVARLDSLVSSLLGNTAKNIRKIFEFASRQPCVLFLDEFDAIAKARDDQHELGELKRVVNSLLQNIDEYLESNILIAATNHHELLDKAIWRRFNSIVEIALPGEAEVLELLKLFLKTAQLNFELQGKRGEALARLLNGSSPADIKAICQNAIAQNVLRKKSVLDHEELLLQYYYYRHHNSTSQEALMGFLNENGVSQAAIAEILDTSLRQVRNFFNQKS
ncbi:SpoVK/Ycf46/Vps4 family AAA+-type ATPase [Spirosoma lacussanchae]|uniref:AAA family ATPase n=1 Tax=Spirosoma lacussanchae TaxID=1884249 RepID=UPI001107C74D|nr:ATP-binding protein [Spirosoma lacussanchae]